MVRLTTVTIPTNRVKNVLDVVATSAGSDSVVVNVEDDGVILTAYASSLDEEAQIYIIVENIGDGTDNVELIEEFPLIVQSGVPHQLSIPVSGNIRITANYNGAASYEIRGKAVSGSALNSKATPVKVELTETDIQNQRDIVLQLRKIDATLNRILNHQRLITGVEAETGEEF